MGIKDEVRFLDIKEDMVEGRDFINIYINSDTLLGKMLSPYHRYTFKTIAGDMGSIMRFMGYIGIKDFPDNLINKSKLSRRDRVEIAKLETLNVPNYWAVLAYATCERVSQDKNLMRLMRNNTLPYTMATKESVPDTIQHLTDAKVCYRNIVKFGLYLNIINDIQGYILMDKFNTESIKTIIESYKSTDDDLFHGTNLILQ